MRRRPIQAEVYFDAECAFCIRLASAGTRRLARHGMRVVPLQSPDAAQELGVPPERLLDEMRLRTAGGEVFGGADAMVEIGRRIWWTSPLWLLSRAPGVMWILRRAYRKVAASRSCRHGACALPSTRRSGFARYLPLVLLPTLALAYGASVPAWAFMWMLAFGIFLGCKWLTYCDAVDGGISPSLTRSAAYLWLWPGMEARTFLDPQARPSPPLATEWRGALAKTVIGIVLLLGVARDAIALHPLVKGWLGMTGAVLILHFGTFHLLSLVWRGLGVAATPVMRRPLLSTSLAEFWGRRWNTAFHELAARFTFGPLRRRLSSEIAALLVFVASGLIHDLVISVPAGGGYGLPTLYFALQGLGVAAERTRFGRALRAAAWRGRTLTLLVVAGPAFLLFHPPFIHNIILPMLHAIGGALESTMNLDLVTLLYIAGILHLGLIAAGLMMPRVVGIREHLTTLPVFIRQLFWVYYSFIGLCLVSFGVITVAFAETLAGGSQLARAVCAFFALFWTVRLVAGTFVFDLDPYLTNPARRIGLAAANLVFAYLPIVYAIAAIQPAWAK